MEVIKAILNRTSTRGFKPDPVPRKVLEELLETCRWAPSSRNMQPWEIAIVGGKVMEEVKARLAEKVKAKVLPKTDLPWIEEPPQPYLARALEERDSLDCHQFPPGTENLDQKRAQYWVKGGSFHYAPNGIVIYIDKALDYKAIIDAGIMAMTISLAAPAYGLGTCIMARVVQHTDVLREMLRIPESKNIVLGIAIGYPDPDAIVNSCPRHRLSESEFTTWHGF